MKINNKIKKSAVLTIATASILITALTMAYFVSSDTVTNRLNAQHPSVELLEPKWYSDGMNLANASEPGMLIDKNPYARNNGKIDIYVRIKMQLSVIRSQNQNLASPATPENPNEIYQLSAEQVRDRILQAIRMKDHSTPLITDIKSNGEIEICHNMFQCDMTDICDYAVEKSEEENTYYFYFVKQALSSVEDSELIVLHPEQSMLLIGSNESGSLDITTLKTQMKRLTNSEQISDTKYLLGFGQANESKGIFGSKYSGEQIIDTKTIVIGANENGLTIEDHFLWHLDSCRTVVLSDCPITLKNCFYGNNNYGNLKLLVFQNTDSDQLNKTTDFLNGGGNKVNTYIVFTGLNSGEADSFLNGVNNARIAGVFYKDTLTPEVIETIKTAVGADYMRPEVENLLYATINAPTPTRPRPPISSQSNAKPQVSTNLAFLTLEQRKFLGLEE